MGETIGKYRKFTFNYRIDMKVKVISVTVELNFGQDFLTFLSQNNALEQFCTKFCNNKSIEYLVSLISRVCPQDWLSSAFGWDDIEFWKNLSDKWKKLFLNLEFVM